MLTSVKESISSLCIGISTFFLGFLNSIFSNLPLIHDLLGTISMALGCVACAIVIVVNYRQAKINKLIEKDLEDKHGKF